MKNRFLVFIFGDYYPAGGANDLKLMGDTLEEAEEKAVEYVLKSYNIDFSEMDKQTKILNFEENAVFENIQIYDLVERRIVKTY